MKMPEWLKYIHSEQYKESDSGWLHFNMNTQREQQQQQRIETGKG